MIGISIDTANDDTIIISISEARELYHQLGELLGPQGDYSTDWSGKQEDWEMPPVSCTADVGRTVWATDGAGNSLSPDELRKRGDAFAAGKS